MSTVILEQLREWRSVCAQVRREQPDLGADAIEVAAQRILVQREAAQFGPQMGDYGWRE